MAAALDGDAEAQSMIGSMYEERDSHEDAVRWYRKAAAQDQPDAQFKLGFYHAIGGGGLAKDLATAVKWFQKAAKASQVAAQYNLAVCYEKGLGVSKDDAAALTWYRRAAAQGETYAQKAVGVFYEQGRGAKPDRVEACAWYKLASARSNPDATRLLKKLSSKLNAKELKLANKRGSELSVQIYKNPLGASTQTAIKKKIPTKDFLE